MLNIIITFIILSVTIIANAISNYAYLFFVFLISLLCVYNIIKMDISKKTKIFILIAFFIRCILVVIDLYYHRLPDTGSDDDGFYKMAVLIKEKSVPMTIGAYGGLYSIMLSILMHLIGVSRVGLQFINVFLYVVSILYLNKSLLLIKCKSSNRSIILLLFSYMPYLMISNSILRRDTLISTLLIISIYSLIIWFYNKKLKGIIVSFLCLSLASLLHNACIFALPCFIILVFFYNRKKGMCQFAGINIFKQLLLLIIIFPAFFYFLSNYSTKFSGVNSMDSVYNVVNYSRGGSAYLTSMNINSIPKLIIYTPIKVLYFAFSPMPWNWRGISDIFAFLFDSCIYLYISIAILRGKRKYNSLMKTILFSGVFVLIVFSLGTFTSGTAIRHRYSILPFFSILYGMINNEKSIRVDDKNKFKVKKMSEENEK